MNNFKKKIFKFFLVTGLLIGANGYAKDTQYFNHRNEKLEKFDQFQNLKKTLRQLESGENNKTDWYLLSVAGSGYQSVFENEVNFLDNWFDKRIGDSKHSISLINSPEKNYINPIANRMNIKHAIEGISEKMDYDDVLFLVVTSHGRRNYIQLKNSRIEVRDLSAKWLKQVLKGSGIRWKVIVLSACYSGSFIDELRDPSVMIITASHADKTSFGCSNDNIFTYFGRAFFVNGLPNSTSFNQAFINAKEEVEKRESGMQFISSEPQIFIGKDIESKLNKFEKSLFKVDSNKK